MSAAANAPVSNDLRGKAPLPMFSQRGYTCGPDTLFTVMFEADPIRRYLLPLLERSPSRLIASKDALKRALGLAIQRFQKMKSVERAPVTGPLLKRAESTNTGEAAKVLNIVSECGPDDIGMRPGFLKKVIHEIFTYNLLELFPTPNPARVVSLPEKGVKPSAIKTDDVFALIFEVDYYKPEPVEENYENWFERRFGAVNASRKTIGGHIVAFFKQDGVWFFADNEVGWLHRMKDQSYVPNHVIKAIKDSLAGDDFFPLTLSPLPQDAPLDIELRHMLMADNVIYSGSDSGATLEFDDQNGFFAGGEVHVLMAPSGGRRHTRHLRGKRAASRKKRA
jgi:hypothetical protein